MTSATRVLCLIATALALLMAGCAADRHYRNAQELLDADEPERALEEYRQAIAEEPTNARFRIAYLKARDLSTQRWLSQADSARLRNDGTLAHSLYLRVLAVDETNARATAGLQDLVQSQRHAAVIAQARTDLQAGQMDQALGRLRAVLTEAPQNRTALALKQQILDKQASPKVNADARLADAYRKPVSLEFRDAQLKQIFDVLSRSSGLNFVLDKDVRGDQRTTIFLRNSTIADALSMTLLTNQLEQRVLDGNSILIYPNNAAKLREYQPLTVKSFVLANGEAKAVAATLKTILKTKDVVVDEKQNMIIMRDSPEAIQMAEKLVALHDQPDPEVMLDVEILEVKRTKLRQLGVQYPTQAALAPMASASGAQLTLADLRNLSSSRISATVGGLAIDAKEVVGDVNVLANPRIRARNHEKAKIQVGQRVPNITSTSTSTGFVSETVQYVDVGLKLEVEPTISPDDEVLMKVGLEVSNILNQLQTKSGSIAYEIGTRNANTVLRLKDGENQVLAGLINDEDRRSTNRIPGLGSVPVIGNHLFGSESDDYQKSEIVLSITPRIVRPAQRPTLDLGEFDSGTEASLRARVFDPASAQMQASVAKTTSAASPTQDLPAKPPVPAPEPVPPSLPPAPATPSAPSSSAPALSPASSSSSDNAPPAAVPLADAPPKPPDAPQPPADGSSTLYWQAPSNVALGQTFTVELLARTGKPASIIPVNLNYDKAAFALVSVEQGNLMANAGSQGTLSKRTDAATGTIRAVLMASGTPTQGAEGSLLTLTFKALAASEAARIDLNEAIQAVSASGEALPLGKPGTLSLRVK